MSTNKIPTNMMSAGGAVQTQLGVVTAVDTTTMVVATTDGGL